MQDRRPDDDAAAPLPAEEGSGGGPTIRRSVFLLTKWLAVALPAFTVAVVGWIADDAFAADAEQLRDALRDVERSVEVVEWGVTWRRYTDPPDGPAVFTGQVVHAHVRLAPASGAIYVEEEVMARTADPDQGLAASRHRRSFDGTATIDVLERPVSDEFGEYAASVAQIREEPLIDQFLEREGSPRSGWGLDFMASTYRGIGLSAALDEAARYEISEAADGVLTIDYLPADQPILAVDVEIWTRVVVDPELNGALTAFMRYPVINGEPGKHPLEVAEIEFADGHLRSVRRVQGSGGRQNVIVLEFSDVQLNHFDPEQNIQRFRVQIPEGTPVLDRREN